MEAFINNWTMILPGRRINMRKVMNTKAMFEKKQIIHISWSLEV